MAFAMFHLFVVCLLEDGEKDKLAIDVLQGYRRPEFQPIEAIGFQDLFLVVASAFS